MEQKLKKQKTSFRIWLFLFKS